jgi:hypothetical protein
MLEMLKKNTKITGGYVYILMYYLPERIFLCKFKYFALKLDFGAWGAWGEESCTVLLMTATGVQKD